MQNPDKKKANKPENTDFASATGDVVSPSKTRQKSQDRTGNVFLPPWIVPVTTAGALLIVGLGGYFIGGGGQTGPKSGLSVARLDQPGIIEALKSVPSGKSVFIGNQGDRFSSIASYRDTNGELCREFEVDRGDTSSVVAVACAAGEAWEIHFSVLAAQTSEGTAPASSLEALDAYLLAVEAGEPLSVEEEAVVLSLFH